MSTNRAVHFLLVGLGNPAREYARTRHNAGSFILDQLPGLIAQRDSCGERAVHGTTSPFVKERDAGGEVCHCTLEVDNDHVKGGREGIGKGTFDLTLTLLKPNEYMNLSGKSVKSALKKYFGETLPQDKPQDRDFYHLIVIHDDMSVEEGKTRLVTAGSSARGHKGVLSIANVLRSTRFPRIRVGIGRPPHVTRDPADVREWVLGQMPPSMISACSVSTSKYISSSTVLARAPPSETSPPGSTLRQVMHHVLELARMWYRHDK